MMMLSYALLRGLIKAAGLDKKGCFEAVQKFNEKAPSEARAALIHWATNTPALKRDGSSRLKVSHRTYLFGGTGNCGNCWEASAGGWYPTAAIVRFGRGLPKLVAVQMDWY